MERDARKGDGRVGYAEGCTRGLPPAAAAVEKGGRWHTTDYDRLNIADVDRGLVEHARDEVHLRGADRLNSISNRLADQRHIAIRVIAVDGVDLNWDEACG